MTPQNRDRTGGVLGRTIRAVTTPSHGRFLAFLERVADPPPLPDDALSPLEAAARAWRRDVLSDLGGPDAVPAARRALLDAATGSMIVLASLDRFLFALAARDGLVNKRSRRVFSIVE